MQKQGTWELVHPPINQSIIGSKWVYKIKRDQNGKISRYKARLVAHGFSQEHGLDYEDTFSLVVRHSTIRLILALFISQSWTLRQLDVKNLFFMGIYKKKVSWSNHRVFRIPLIQIMYVSLLSHSMDLNKLLKLGIRNSHLICLL